MNRAVSGYEKSNVNSSISCCVHRGRLNDSINADGSVKPHWQYVLQSLQEMGPEALAARQAKAHRILRDDGATYNLFADQRELDQTWKLDLVPSLIDSTEWSSIEAGLLERAELFNLLLKDIYGPRRLIQQGVIPPEVVFSHPGFLRACQDIQIPGEHLLIQHSVDLMRDTQGNPCVLADRCQAPNGAGYALENRTVMSRVLPSLFRDSHVHRLASYFQKLRSKLVSLAPEQEQARIVLLTTGANNSTYFEHAYLANYLGFYLVQSGDLVVRNGRVWMKSLDGLRRVDVILRRVEDWLCDPVELRGDSPYGIPNLLEVARAGHVVIANPLGTGILENPVFLKYLPEISKALLGRELRLGSVQTYWCGDDKDRGYVLSNVSQLVIKSVFYPKGHGCILGAQLTETERQALIDKINRKPTHYVAQPLLTSWQLPVFTNNELQARPALLRTFTSASENSYTVMPGGLTRVGNELDTIVISSQTGARSKDTWVLASEPQRTPTAVLSGTGVSPQRQAELISLPSRVIENLFWMGRYAERAEASLRLLRTVFLTLNGDESLSLEGRRQLLQTVTLVSDTAPGFTDANDQVLMQPEDELLRVIGDQTLAGSVLSNLNAMLNSAEQSQELLSSDMMRLINDIRDALSELHNSLASGFMIAPEEALDPLVTALLALSGLTLESMIRGEGWRFMMIGRRLERVLQTSKIISGLIVPEMNETDQSILIQSLLLSQEVLVSYRRQYGARMGIQSSLDLVMLDPTNPRSLLYQLEQLYTHLSELPAAQQYRNELPPERRAAMEVLSLIKMSVLTQLSTREQGQRKQLAQNMSRVTHLLNSVSHFLSDKYFEHRMTSQQLVQSVWESLE